MEDMMPRLVRNAKLDTRSARAKLQPRREPYWAVMVKGAAVGYRRGKRGGAWIARWRNDQGLQRYQALGMADDSVDADGVRVLTFAQAQEKARKWFADAAKAATGYVAERPYTVADAIREYLDHYANRGGKRLDQTRRKAEVFILPKLGTVELSKLTTKQLSDWHANLAASPIRLRTAQGQPQRFGPTPSSSEAIRRRRATANRVFTLLKAALNHAFKQELVADDAPWRRTRPYAGVNAPRVRYLQLEEVQRLVDATDRNFRPLVLAALYTGARYGELIALCVRDFDAAADTLTIQRSKSGKCRHIVLNDDGSAFFAAATAGRPSDAPMFTRPDGKTWAEGSQQWRLRNACQRAGIQPAASFHVLRHTYASHLAMNGAPLPVIAAYLGHSNTAVTEKHYAHLSRSHLAEVIRRCMPNFGIGMPGDVTASREGAASQGGDASSISG
jgi:integrase